MKKQYSGKFKIYAGLHEESKEGWVWLPKLNKLAGIEDPKWRVVKIIRKDDKKKKIVVERRIIDKNFVTHYNDQEHTKSDLKENETNIVMNYNYRSLLNVSPRDEVRLIIKKANLFDRLFIGPSQHPNIFVKYSIWLGMLSALLGIVSILIALLR